VIVEIHKFDPTLPVTHVIPLDKLLSESVVSRKLSTFLLGLFPSVALLLATIGVYAVMTYAVRLLTNEIGRRMALGPHPQNIWWLVIGSDGRIVLAGIGIGLVPTYINQSNVAWEPMDAPPPWSIRTGRLLAGTP
jgi:hypothetical protein